MAGAGYKLFNTGDVLTAAQVNTYLMEQTVMRFATTTARDTALSGVLAEGMICYIDADNNLYKYTGSAWVNVDTGSSSPLTTKGDLYTYSTSDTRLASSAVNGDVLTVDTSTATGLKWAAPSGSSGPAFRVYRNTSQQSFNQNTQTKVQFNAETFDTDNCFDSTTNYRFTANKSGYYDVSSFITFSGVGSETVKEVTLYKNGSANSRFFSSQGSGKPGATCTVGGSVLVYLNGTTDYLEIFVYDSDASARNVLNGESVSYFSGVWIRS